MHLITFSLFGCAHSFIRSSSTSNSILTRFFFSYNVEVDFQLNLVRLMQVFVCTTQFYSATFNFFFFSFIRSHIIRTYFQCVRFDVTLWYLASFENWVEAWQIRMHFAIWNTGYARQPEQAYSKCCVCNIHVMMTTTTTTTTTAFRIYFVYLFGKLD